MRYHTLSALEKHLAQASFETQGNLFGILAEDSLERWLIRDKICSFLKKKFPEVVLQELDLQQSSLQELLQEMDSVDLFASQKIYVLKSLEKLSKEQLDFFIKKLPSTQCFGVIFEGWDGKVETKLYEKLKKQMVVLDLSKEKPWDKKTRLISWLEAFAAKEKKTLQKEAAEILYERCQKQFSWMYQELEKLLCFAKDSAHISVKDLHQVCGLEADVNTYVLCEGIIFGGQEGIKNALNWQLDSQDFFSLLGQLRFQLHIGMKLTDFLKRGLPIEEFEGSFVYNIQKNLPKYIKACQNLSRDFFFKGLVLLCEYERRAKSQSIEYQALFTSLVMQLAQFKQVR